MNETTFAGVLCSTEEMEAIDRQNFLDALADEGVALDAERREIIRAADSDKWQLFIARLLARAFKLDDLDILEDKPKEVYIVKE